ncbi:uncharacterized protein LOC135200810 [Macrobrachium nipponense]|uniref:uncharacterized protein LOC135200810 n=1 Tax=Macrobrachium nipponense TaxID=159736 RepID=UPI0030C8A232
MYFTVVIITLLSLSRSSSQDVFQKSINPAALFKKLAQSCDGHNGGCGADDQNLLASEDKDTSEHADPEVSSQPRETGCQPYTHACVPYYQCIDGEINTSGTGLIDVRSKPLRECTDPQNPTIPGVCCRIPGATTPEPEKPCQAGLICVERIQCNADGAIKTDGSGVIDVRAHTKIQPCRLNTNSYESGVCCKPTPLEVCPNYKDCILEYECHSVTGPEECYIDKRNGVLGVCCDRLITNVCPEDAECIPESDCLGEIWNSARNFVSHRPGGDWYPCISPTGNKRGVCCRRSDPCPGDSVCIPEPECKGEIWNRARTFAPYRPNGDWYPCISPASNIRGVCCRRSDPCPGDSVCIPEPECKGEIWNRARTFAPYRPNGDWYPCISPASNIRGVCCRRSDPCPGDSVCIPEPECKGEIWNRARTFAPYRPNGDWYPCISPDGNIRGVCCRRSDPCPGDSVCVPEPECKGEIWNRARTFVPYRPNGDWYPCISPDDNIRGVCCRREDPCPGDSLCIPESECKGEIWNRARTFAPYGPNGDWYHCTISDGRGRGVCCRRSEIKDPKYIAATECGIRNYGREQRSRGTLGKNAALFGEFPWQAILFFRNYTYKCGASIVGNRWLITGAHCVNGYTHKDFRARLGEWQVDVYDEPLPYFDADISLIYAHPNFNADNLRNNIAIIELETPVKFQYHINAICLPSYSQTLSPGTVCIASGWGKDAFTGSYQAILNRVEVPFVGHGQCEELLRKTRLGRFFKLHESFMCAGGEENKDVCTGDGGGPLACKDLATGKYYLQGITSWGIDCGQKDVPGVYADVRFFSEWIKGIIRR